MSSILKATQLCLSLFLPLSLVAQFPNILLDKAVRGEYPPCEPSIAINLTDTDNILGAAILDKAYVTKDGGKTWKTVKLTSPYGVFGDPCVISDSKGNFYYFHLADPKGKGRSKEAWLDRIVSQKSVDGGLTWDKGTFMGYHPPKDQDKEWAAVDLQNDYLYTTWTQFDHYGDTSPDCESNILFARSKNGSKSWEFSKPINQKSGDCIDDDDTTEGAVPTVGPNGEVYVSWALRDTLFFNRSLDKGKSWLQEELVAAVQEEGWALDIPGIFRANGMPVTVCDVSNGPNRGTIYINYADQSEGTDDTDIWLIKSTDQGNSWSTPKRVNDDGPSKHQFFSWMTIDQSTGYLYVVFYDRRAYDDIQTDVYLAFSKNGGETFTNVKISETPFTPKDKVFFGDYTHIAAHNGIVCPIWTRMDKGKTSVMTAVIQQKDLEK
ncbi:MAG: sialidase family protein [Bacteroidota bacterium]